VPSRIRPLSWLLAVPGLSLALAASPATVTTSAAGPVAHEATHNCSTPKYPGLGYFTSLSVSGTSCSTGSKVAIAYYHCRIRHGAAGRCSGGVLGFSCSERRNSIPTEIDARVTCRRQHATVIHTFQQDI
jgi:hypothetical protein